MSKIIIHNLSSKPDSCVIQLVQAVTSRGFESGEKQYCWVTVWEGLQIEVHAMKTRGDTFTFKVVDQVK